ncbi:MAG: hypothetical protein A2W91_18200 [Bacteroidetes bacterium GWF2_38_335]|nr:MAG: hypothetical protein A2W91_18200 [Bacteroidetes bacterium GWF2_38_335]OFY80102.1 MAG: hypothetical protein A2281_12440 [Bacteroidetes bacterium RIFOXYA12_FULL_38_20]HBS88572.1 hypothetical protein [Bacteroidales bacterium]
MAILSGGVFKQRKAKPFDYKPRYFSPEKQELESRVNESKRKYGDQEAKSNVPDYETNIRNNFRQNKDYKAMKERNFSRMKLMIRIITISMILIIGVLVYQLLRMAS